MLSRILSRLLIVACIGVFVGVAYYFYDEYGAINLRERVVREAIDTSHLEGPCAGLASLARIGPAGVDLENTLSGLRNRLVSEVVGGEDLRGRRVLAQADREGIIDRSLCEQIRLSHQVGEVHPVLAFLRYTRDGGNPCEEEPRLAEVLDGLGSHRGIMLRALMGDVRELGCFSPALAEKVAVMVANAAAESPFLLDGLDEARIAAFLTQWAPVETAQLGCEAMARGGPSKLAKAVGCSAEARRRVLVHYQAADVPGLAGSPAADRDVVLLRQTGPFCEVMPAAGGALRTVACRSLRLASDLVLAVRIEALSYGRAEADLVAGLATYVGATGELKDDPQEPELHSWFGYNRDGELIGAAHRVELGAVAALLGEAVPDDPLRSFCKRSGAKYCYDVDWAHVVSRLRGAPLLFLSRPAAVFLAPVSLTPEETAARFHQAFGRDPAREAYWRVYGLGGGGAELALESTADDVSLRWRTAATAAWRTQAFGRSEGGANPASASFIAALDIQKDGHPALIIHRTAHAAGSKTPSGPTDELLLVSLPAGHDKFSVLNRLTIHEY